MTLLQRITLSLGAVLAAQPALAQQPLCQNSPENPTAILGLLGAAVTGYPYARDRLRQVLARRKGMDVHADET